MVFRPRVKPWYLPVAWGKSPGSIGRKCKEDLKIVPPLDQDQMKTQQVMGRHRTRS